MPYRLNLMAFSNFILIYRLMFSPARCQKQVTPLQLKTFMRPLAYCNRT